MNPAVDIAEQRLERLESELSDLSERFASEVIGAASADEVDDSYMERFQKTIRQLLDLNDDLHEDDFDPRALAEFRGIIIEAIRTADQANPDRPLDAIDGVLVRAEQLRHIIRDAIDGHVTGIGRNSADVMGRLREWLPTVSLRSLADLLGRSDRQVQRWAAQDTPPAHRLDLVTRLVALLRYSWTEEGIVAWFYRARPELDGKRPIDLLDDPNMEVDLLVATRRGRAQHGG